jgi:hypothetical protein
VVQSMVLFGIALASDSSVTEIDFFILYNKFL